MQFDEFMRRFQGSLRTKNLNSPIDTIWKKTASNKRVHHLVRQSELPDEFIRQDPWEAEYLFMVATRAKKGIVETGRFNGGSCLLMACANEAVPIYSIDIAPQNDALLKSLLESFGIGGNVELIVGDSQNVKYPQINDFDMLFIDGDHSYEGCTRDLENWYGELAEGGHILLHDSYHGSEVMDACIDFIERHDPIVHISPFKHANHSTHPAGSIAHFQKRRSIKNRRSKTVVQ